MSLDYIETLDEHLLVYLIKYYLSQAEQINFYRLSKYTFKLLYRPCGLKRHLRFKTCFRRNCSYSRFAPFSGSPISSFCKQHFPKATSTIESKKSDFMFLISNRVEGIKKDTELLMGNVVPKRETVKKKRKIYVWIRFSVILRHQWTSTL